MTPRTPVWAAALYRAAWALAVPAVLARFWWRGRIEPAYRDRWAQRLGRWSDHELKTTAAAATAPSDRPRIWLHAVSLGETRAAQPLVNALRQCLPGMQLLLTTGTATGWEAGKGFLQPGDLHGWVPLDTVAATRRFFAGLQPTVGILMETETWPNLLAQAQAAGVPVLLANARLSERSLKKGHRWSALARPMMSRLSGVLAQTQDDADRFLEAGVRPERLQVMGNLKFDLQPPADVLARGLQWKANAPVRRIVLAASWREGEDSPLLQAWRAQCDAACGAGQPPAQRPLLLVVPRHPQRFDEVHAALRSMGWSVSRRSTWGPEGPADHDWAADAWLGDSIGEMAAYYALADVALLGGSFAPLGGQNLIEAAACGCPVIAGPHTFNFEEAAQRAIEEGAARRAPKLEEAVQQALALPTDQLQAHRTAARAFCERHAGAAARQARYVAQLLGSAAQQG